MANDNNSVLYTGVTSDLVGRIIKHKSKIYHNSFTAKYSIHKLVYYKKFEAIGEAILREKQIKGGSRKRKIDLITEFNPEWNDLSLDLTQD